jgi:diaminobutyrate acetyltransferase
MILNETTSTPNSANRATIGHPHLRHPVVSDGGECHRLVADTGVLDLNSAYAYVLWCADFSATSAVAERDGRLVGLITGYRRPESPSTLMIWQVAVDRSERGRGLASTMLDWLVADVVAPGEQLTMHTTVSPENTASRALFAGFARRWNTEIVERPGFPAHLFPDAHDDEPLLSIGPLSRVRRTLNPGDQR